MKLKDLLKLPVQGYLEVVVYDEDKDDEVFCGQYDMGDVPGLGVPTIAGLMESEKAELKPYMNCEVKYCFSREYGRTAYDVCMTCFRVELLKLG